MENPAAEGHLQCPWCQIRPVVGDPQLGQIPSVGGIALASVTRQLESSFANVGADIEQQMSDAAMGGFASASTGKAWQERQMSAAALSWSRVPVIADAPVFVRDGGGPVDEQQTEAMRLPSAEAIRGLREIAPFIDMALEKLGTVDAHHHAALRWLSELAKDHAAAREKAHAEIAASQMDALRAELRRQGIRGMDERWGVGPGQQNHGRFQYQVACLVQVAERHAFRPGQCERQLSNSMAAWAREYVRDVRDR